MGMRKRKHAGFRPRKGPKRPKTHSGHTTKDLASNPKNKYETSSREVEEEKAIDSPISSSSDEEENPLKQLVSDLCKNSTKNQDVLSDELVEDSDDELVEEEQEEDIAEGEVEETDLEEEEVEDNEEEEVDEEDNEGEEEEEVEENEEAEEVEDNEEEEEIEVEDNEVDEEDNEGEEEVDEEHVEEDDEEAEEDLDEEEVEETFASSSEEESDAEIEEDNEVHVSSGKDPFVVHFESVIPDKYAEKLDSGQGWQKDQLKLPFGKCVSIWNGDNFKAEVLKSPENNLEELHVRQKLINNLQKINTGSDKNKDAFSPFQNQMFQLLNSYQDFYSPQKTLEQSEEVEKVYCLHVLNHVLKSRTQVINHDITLKASKDKDSTEEFLDQGLTRPKVLIIVPFRETARRIVSNFIKLMGGAETQTDSKKRFFTEFSLQEEEVVNEKKPEDYRAVFAGNTDDHFRIGISLSRKRFKLYTKFYSSDIIIASPLGLRTVIGGEQDSKKDIDFLSSIEILILDQTDIFLMQNWEHLMLVMNHLHQQPKESHDCDFSRVRHWSLNGWSKYYRQTIILSSLPSPPITLLFNKYCFNYAGKLQVYPASSSGTICQVALQLPLVFHKVEAVSYAKLADARFNVFIKKILPKFKDSAAMRGTMIFIPSYFDFVRIRNHFNRKEIKFLQINEYLDEAEVARTRSQFFLGKTQFLLYTERRHFYFRPRIRGVHHVIFYELPLYSHFFSEVCNMMYDSKSKKGSKNDVTGTVLYSKYDAQRLAGVVGTDRAALMINSSKALHMFVTDS